MSELTLTLLRLGLLALLWIFIFSVVGVLRTDIYGTAVRRRGRRKARREAEQSRSRTPRTPVPAASAAGAPAPSATPAKSAGEPAGGSGWRGRGRSKAAATKLVVTEGPLTGTSLPLRSGGILIGRNPECALVLDDDYASGRHCRIYPDPSGRDGWVVEDLGSTNGTFIGRDRLTGTRPVEVGTSLRIGKTVLELRG